jgi:hypothetical protein
MLVATWALLASPLVLAVPPQPVSRGVNVNPAITPVVIRPDQIGVDFLVTLENDTAQTVVITPRANDFYAGAANGSISLLSKPNSLHGLMRNLTFSPAQLTIEPGKVQQLHVSITDTSVLAPGGHFTTIRYQIAPLVTSNSKDSVDIKSEIASFIFLTTAGKSTYDVSLKTSLPSVALWQPPMQADLLFTNTGNTQTAPRGRINVSGPLHTQLGNGAINSNSSLVLPGSTRLFQTDIRKLKTAIFPGRYAVDIYYRPSETTTYKHIHQNFFFIGWPALVVGVSLIAGMAYLVRLLWRRAHKHTQKMTAIAPQKKRRTIPIKHL